MCTSLLLLDASANEEYQEEEYYQEAEAEDFEQYQNQGKLLLYVYETLPIPSFIFTLFYQSFSYSLLWSEVLVVEGAIKSIKLGLAR